MLSSTFLSAAFAAAVLAVPMPGKRDLVIDTVIDVVYVTDMVTETAGAVPAATSTVEATSTKTAVAHYGHHTAHSSAAPKAPESSAASVSSVVVVVSSSVVPSTTAEPSPTSEAPASSAAPVSSSVEATSTAASATALTYQEAVVNHHNYHRANHSAPNIVWSQSLADTAQTIAESCKYAHNTEVNGGGYGQNIAAGVNATNIGQVITDLFYNGEVNYYDGLYGQASPDMTNFEHWGHFSQIVWKATTSVGCWTQFCPGEAGLYPFGDGSTSGIQPFFTVCNYESPGNYGGEYTNVGSPLGHSTITGNYNVAITSKNDSQ